MKSGHSGSHTALLQQNRVDTRNYSCIIYQLEATAICMYSDLLCPNTHIEACILR